MKVCEVCGEPARIIGMERVDNGSCDDERRFIEHLFCDEHYTDWRNNVIEIPVERLDILND